MKKKKITVFKNMFCILLTSTKRAKMYSSVEVEDYLPNHILIHNFVDKIFNGT